MKKVQVGVAHLNPLYQTLKMFERKSLGIKSAPKDVPMWLPNGEEIKTVSEMASMLNVDVKTASYCILDSKNAPELLRLEASYEVKEVIKHVRTQAGQEKYKEPIGAVIKLDSHGHVIKDVVEPIEAVAKVKRVKKAVAKKAPIKKSEPKVKKRRSIEPITRSSDDVIKLRDLADKSFEPLTAEPIPLRPIPKMKMSQLGGRDWESVKPEEQERIQKFYEDVQQWEGIGEPSKQLKANVQHNIAQRLLDYSLTDPEFQQWSDAKIQSLFMSTRQVLPPEHIFESYDNIKAENDLRIKNNLPFVAASAPEFDEARTKDRQIMMQNKVNFLKELGIVPWNKTVNANDKEDPYYNFYHNGENSYLNEDELFPKTIDREKLMRYNLLATLGLTTRFENRTRTQSVGDRKKVNELTEHTTHELLYLQMTRDTITQWAHTSADTEPDSIAMQMDAKDVFGLHDSATDHLSLDTFYESSKETKLNKLFREVLLKAMYEDTQDFFKANGITHVELHRGMKFDDMGDAPDWMKTPDVQDAIFSGEYNGEYSVDPSLVDEYVRDNFNDDDFFQMTWNKFEDIFDKKYSNKEYIDLVDKEIERRKANGDTSIDTENVSQWNSIGDEIKQEEYDKWHEENDKPNDTNSLFAQMKKEYEDQLAQYYIENSDDSGEEIWANNKMADTPLDIRGQMQPISSWSLDPDEALKFSGEHLGLVMRATVPVERILSTSFSGFGCLNEDEMVVLGGHIDTETRFRT